LVRLINIIKIELPDVMSIDLSNNRITSILSKISDLKQVLSLNFSKNNINEIPDAVANMDSLMSLYLQGNPLSEESMSWLVKNFKKKAVYDITALKKDKLMTPLQKAIDKLEEAVNNYEPVLDFSGLNLTTEDLKELTRIIMGKTKVEGLNNTDFLKEYINNGLRILNFSGNNITTIPREFKELSKCCNNLSVLELSLNKINEFPRFLDDFKNIELVYLSGNQIKKVSFDFCLN
jgi:Leucine-rich repeat (LRR) protein